MIGVSSKKMIVEMQGGLGNRLFQLFAGLYAAEKLHSNLVVDTSKLPRDTDSISSCFESLNFADSRFQRIVFKKTKFKLFWRLLAYLARRGNVAKTFVFRVFSYHVQSSVGFDSSILKLKHPLRINGYFQTWKYIHGLGLSKPEIVDPSSWFSSNLNRIVVSKPILIHVRLGDYVDNRNGIGLLSAEYYVAALNHVSRQIPNAEVWVFSNDIDGAKSHLELIYDRVDRWVSPPLDAQSCESLILMTKGSALIMSNSTFSWWAGYWSDESVKIISPKVWFRNIEQPLELQPQQWTRIPSYWVE